ncbi:MAG: energy-coupling factor transporter ATPase [Clostridiales bacterium]|nr:energy-coupling factor transporter ATPase [Clostridiales bacterium]
MLKNLIEIENVSFSYEEEGEPAVKNVSLSIPKGAFYAVLGQNGSGKSTLAKLMNGLYKPSSGTVKVYGMDTADDDKTWEIRQRAGMVFQNPDNQLVATVVKDDVAFGLENIGVPTEDMPARIEQALRDVGMQEFADRSPHHLSGGQKQRVAIAGALAMQSDIIIFDEATAMLDPRGRQEVFSVVQQLNRNRGLTVVWITHYMEEAALADRVFVMHRGEVVLEGTPSEVFSHADILKKCKLRQPPVTEIAENLREKGFDISSGVLTAEDMVREVKRLCASSWKK